VGATAHRARVVWDGSRDDLRAHRVELAEQSLAGSAMPQNGGDPGRADPEELLVAALSSCHMLWFLDFARRRRLRVASYEDEAEGVLDGERFTSATLRPRASWEGDTPSAAELTELHEQAHGACYIANSVAFPVEVEPRE
jgi:organic hydroperoxide reductase OsmC/OhrA